MAFPLNPAFSSLRVAEFGARQPCRARKLSAASSKGFEHHQDIRVASRWMSEAERKRSDSIEVELSIETDRAFVRADDEVELNRFEAQLGSSL